EAGRVVARVHLERTAAARQARRVNVEALGAQHLGGGHVHVVEEDTLHAALEQADAAALLAARRRELPEALLRPAQRRLGRERGERAQARERAAAARGFRHPQLARRRQQRRERAQPARVREELEQHVAVEAVAERTAVVALHLRARVLDQLVVL